MLETERLILRPFTLEDLPRLIEMRSDPEVNVFMGGNKMQNAEAVTKRLRVYMDSYEKNGYGVSAIIWKETSEMIGWGGLQPLDVTNETEVGYGMIKEFWGKGIASEVARAWLDFGFNEKNLSHIVAVAYPENKGSRHVLEKLGMRYEKTAEHYGTDCVFYTISKEDYLKNQTK